MKLGVLRSIRNKAFSRDKVYDTISGAFDRNYYLSSYPDVRSSGIDPVRHYIENGHGEGRDPTRNFSTQGYLDRYPDVAAAGMNAFYHYLRHGRAENRSVSATMASWGKRKPDEDPVEIVLAPRNGKTPLPLAEHLPGLDQAKVSRLLGDVAVQALPRSRRIGMTAVLRDTGAGPQDNSSDTMVAGLDGAELAEQMLEAARGHTLSLDVWDTILRRDCAPDAIKLRNARAQWLTRIDPEGPLSDLHPVDLLHLRRMAEADAADVHFEYRMAEVAERLAPMLGMPGEDFAGSFLEQELRIERSAISLDPVVAQVIAGHEGRKLVLSDFYMPGSALEALLAHVGVTTIDAVYASCDHMATKRAGSLYDLALKHEKLDAGRVLHIGDRFGADVAAARDRGLGAFHYHSPSQQPRLDRLDGGFWRHVEGDVASHAIGLAEALGYKPGEEPGLEMLSVAATGFVLHVMEEALRRKVDKVFFFTREGEFFRRIYDVMVTCDVFDLGAYPSPVVIEVSRRATFAASLGDFTIPELMRLFSQYSTQSVTALATTLNIDVALWAPIAAKFGLGVGEKVEVAWRDRRFAAFLKHREVVRIARAAILEQRAQLMRYLDAKGFDPRAEVARVIVDIGWRGTIQDNIARIVAGTLHGCYFGLERFLNQQGANVSKTGYVFDANRGYPLRLSEVAGLEFLFNAPGGSTTGYVAGTALRDVVPEEEAIVVGPVADMQERLLVAAGTVARHVRRHGLVSADIVSFAREILVRFADGPPLEVAESFFQLRHNESFGVGGIHSMQIDTEGLAATVALDGARLHGEITRRLKDLRWPAAAQRLPTVREVERRLSPSQRLHLPPALVRAGSLGQPRIAILSPAPIRGSGGLRTIYNLAASLARRGYQVDLMHEGPTDHATQDWIESVLGDVPLTHHGSWHGRIAPAASIGTIWYSQQCAATFWGDETPGFYFVQDYEAMFNPVGDTYLAAEASYSAGARHICVGRWLAHALRMRYGVGVASGGLGVDHGAYRPLNPGPKEKRIARNPLQIALLYQPEKHRRAPELCIAALAIVKARLPDTHIVLYGSDETPKLSFKHEHLGLIDDVNQINDLYNRSSAGLCISSTNPSRIPFEMMAAGCVPVDIYRYNNLFDYETGTGLLAHESPESIAEALLHLLTNPAECARRSAAGIAAVRDRSLDWEMDVAVNAVQAGMAGLDFDTLGSVRPAYNEDPIVADQSDTPSVRHFLAYQRAQAHALFPG